MTAIDEPGSSTGIVLCECRLCTAGQTSVSARPSFSVKNIDQNKRFINIVFKTYMYLDKQKTELPSEKCHL